MSFFDSTVCTNGHHCIICREKKDGGGFRRGQVKFFGEPTDEDFECPYGGEWGKPELADPPFKDKGYVRPNPPTLREMAENFTKAAAIIARSRAKCEVFVERLEGCRSCPEGLWDENARFGAGKCNHPKCGCTMAKMLYAVMRCPLDPPQWIEVRHG